MTFQYLSAYVWRRVAGWIRRKHPGISRREFRRRYCDGGWWPRGQEVALFNAGLVTTTRYRYRGSVIPHPGRWARHEDRARTLTGTCGEPAAGTTRTAGSGVRSGETGWPEG